MPLSFRLIVLALPVVLMGCVIAAPIVPMPPMSNACGAASFQPLIGQPFGVLAATTFIGPMRIIRPDTAVTMDYIAERLNVYLNDDDIITGFTCG